MIGDPALARWIERRPENLARFLGLRVAPFHQLIYEALLAYRSLLVLAPRGTGKTFALAVLVTWLLISRPENRDPAIGELFPGAPEEIGPHNIAILVGSHTREHAWETLDLIRQFLKRLEPVYGMLERRGTRSELDTVLRSAVRKEPSVRALGRDSRWAGSHYDLHAGDDLVTKEVARSAQLTRKLESDFGNDIAPTLRPYGRSTWFGTRWAPTDLYGELIRRTQGTAKC